MERTTIMLPHDLKTKASQFAGKKGISLGQLIRDSLNQSINADNNVEKDPIFMDEIVFEGEVPIDLSENHDDYLYRD